jgi:hypothetical protein
LVAEGDGKRISGVDILGLEMEISDESVKVLHVLFKGPIVGKDLKAFGA